MTMLMKIQDEGNWSCANVPCAKGQCAKASGAKSRHAYRLRETRHAYQKTPCAEGLRSSQQGLNTGRKAAINNKLLETIDRERELLSGDGRTCFPLETVSTMPTVKSRFRSIQSLHARTKHTRAAISRTHARKDTGIYTDALTHTHSQPINIPSCLVVPALNYRVGNQSWNLRFGFMQDCTSIRPEL